jgi:hypothetical protein
MSAAAGRDQRLSGTQCWTSQKSAQELATKPPKKERSREVRKTRVEPTCCTY